VLPIERQLLFHTDYRSPKIEQIQKNNSISWLFYDSKSRIQLRIKSLATLHYQDDISRQRWNDTKTESRKCYFVQPAPSTPSLFPTDGLPSSYYEKEKSKEQNEIGYQHFVVVRTQVKEIDWLYLHHSGHRRARFIYNKDEVYYQWLIP
jgi:3-hydroxyisobutyrate dehydrogenase